MLNNRDCLDDNNAKKTIQLKRVWHDEDDETSSK